MSSLMEASMAYNPLCLISTSSLIYRFNILESRCDIMAGKGNNVILLLNNLVDLPTQF